MKKLALLFISVGVYLGFIQAAVPGISPVISDDTHETWYILQFKNSGKVIQDMGDNEKLQIVKQVNWSDDQLWKIVAADTEGEYQLVGKSGRKIALIEGGPGYADSNRYGASSTLATNFTINYCGSFVFDFERVGSPNHESLNKKESGDGGEVGEWTNKDNSSDNHIYLALPKEMPKISDADQEYWYNIIFERSQAKEATQIKAFTYKGEDTNLQQELLNTTNYNQLWKIVRTENADNEYYIVNKNGSYISIAHADEIDGGGRKYQATQDVSKAEAFAIESIDSKLSAWTIRRISAVETTTPEGVKKDHKWMNDQQGGTICEYDQDDAGAGIRFIEVTALREMPKISDENTNYWYNLLFVSNQENGKTVITYQGEDQDLRQEAYVEDETDQWWRFVAVPDSEDEYYIENKNNAKITLSHADEEYTGNRIYQASVTTTPVKFKLGGGYADYTTWSLLRSGMEKYECMNNKADGTVCEWYQNDVRSALQFLFVKEEDGEGSSSALPNQLVNQTSITVDGATIRIDGEGIRHISVYTITGQPLYHQVSAHELTVTSAGCYIIQIARNDGQSEVKKVIVK